MRRTCSCNLGRPKWVKFHVEHNSSSQIQSSINEFYGQRDFSARDLFIKFNSCILRLTFVQKSIFTRSFSLNLTDRTFSYLARLLNVDSPNDTFAFWHNTLFVCLLNCFLSFFLQCYTSAPNCRDHDGNIRQIGDVWKPSDLSTCTCTGPQQIECHIALPPLTFKPFILPCIDGQQNSRQPGEVWLEDPRTNCSCTQNNAVRCSKLPDPVCLDASGNFRKNFETWLNGSCVECACVNGSINCTRYEVNITYGLYQVDEYPTCQECDIPTKTAMAVSSCKGG